MTMFQNLEACLNTSLIVINDRIQCSIFKFINKKMVLFNKKNCSYVHMARIESKNLRKMVYIPYKMN